MQHGYKAPEVKRSLASEPLKEPLPGRLMNRLSEWKKIGGDKLELKDGVVKPVPESDAKWFNQTFMVIMKNGKLRKILDNRAQNEEEPGKHFLKDSQETVVELLEENDWMTTMDISSAYQHVKVDEQFSPYLCFSFQNQAYSFIGMPFGAKDAPRGSFEIDLTGDSPVPEESGLDSFGGEAEFETHKEWGVFGMELELREDGSDAPREEESAAARGRAKMDSTCKGKKETKDEGPSSTPREVEFREVTTPSSELVDEAHAIRAEAGNSPRRLERDGETQPNDVGRINTLEKGPAREQTKESEEKSKASRVNDRRVRAGMGCSANKTEGEQRGVDLCPRKLDLPRECVSINEKESRAVLRT
ncbi:uncharacterized protein MONOS_16305 [Monocercomonoides exilis]|uniref:uncharacterized protein n=1 Tax=Monocercomonoides exilis TaxID=2049356 RepID=UPI00355A7078|nr:hypothetical protein MONOS_16305 [Monocercomonoides exilis]|eukprot:MONOS_16305.1-p1 / transcript=MONOS_16305.1 / gene=MONOS_16305 / organism=Monocercomonoides_exilis_PA203 / gene_product=unspecified product / transcript_product=unspecified product / location=Mono_scaffold01632:2905-4217(-) / protein_length=360 / sequence_SO=supercontig / SO=protein_coding / is_pseudo=false